MARRTREGCPLCGLTPEQHAGVWYAYQDAPDKPADARWEAASLQVQRAGLACTPEVAKRHFQYDRPLQPAPRGNLKRAAALERLQALPERLRAIVALISRVPALSGSQIAEMFYHDGTPAQWNSARNAAYRDLNILTRNDLLYRLYPPSSATNNNARRARQETLALYFLGRDGVPYVEVLDDVVLGRESWITDPADVGDMEAIYEQQDAAEAVCALARQAREMRARNLLLSVNQQAVSLTFNPSNWFGRRSASVSFHEPVTQGIVRLRPGALATIGMEIQGRERTLLAPFFLEYVSGTRPVDRVADKLLRYAELRMSGALGDRFPDLRRAGAWIPPLLVVCREPERVAALQAAVARVVERHDLLRDGRAPVAVVTDEPTLLEYGLTGNCWTSLWDKSESPTRYGLFHVLTNQLRPLVGYLDRDSVLTLVHSGASHANPGGRQLPPTLPSA